MAKKHKKNTRKKKIELGRKIMEARGISNGFVPCAIDGGTVDRSVCIVAQIRHPRKCAGCHYFGD